MTPNELARELGVSPKTLRAWLRQQWPQAQPYARWDLSLAQVEVARARFRGGGSTTTSLSARSGPEPALAHNGRGRRERDESYVLDLLDEILGRRGLRQHTFDWLTGDPSASGVARRLPVDVYYPDLNVVVEYRERQHEEAVAFFDKPDRMTVSGVHRGEQRRLYDERRNQLIPQHGLRLLVIKPSELAADRRGRLFRDQRSDGDALRAILNDAGIATPR